MLNQFAEKQHDANVQIGDALQRGDRKLAERIAHTVKGVAGNIGIAGIQSAAAKLEKAIREDDPAISASLEQFSSLLASQVCAIREALPDRAPAYGNDGNKSPLIAQQASTAVARLRTLLEANDGDAGEAFLGLKKALEGHGEHSLLEALGLAVNDFEFDTATAKLEQIARELNLNGGKQTHELEENKIVMVVDDAPANIQIVNSILKDTYKVRVATTGAKALQLASATPALDLILLDVMMPEMDGYEVCTRLKAAADTRDIPVIFLTGQIETENETKGFEVGAVDYIHKPFSPAIMKARVNTHLVLRGMREQLERQLLTIQSELETARDIQLSILPREIPQLEGLDIAARYIPMTSVAGDFYDFLIVDEERLGILIADVSGHGMPAALISSMLKIAVAGQHAQACDPSSVLSGLNDALCGKFQGHYVTAAYALIDTGKETISYAGAGHPPLLIRSQYTGTTRQVLENGLFLGYFPEATYSAVEVPFKKGDWCVLYTDGISEMTNPSGEQFGMNRLQLFLEEHHDLTARTFVDSLLDELARWSDHASGREAEDDITLLAVHLNQ